MLEVGKKLGEIHDAMLKAYRETKNKEEGARLALRIYRENAADIQRLSDIILDIENFREALAESLRVLREERLREEKRSRTMSFGGCIVVKLVPCGKNCRGCPHGPYAYRVYKIGGKQHWKYLGKA